MKLTWSDRKVAPNPHPQQFTIYPVKLVGTSKEAILKEAQKLLYDKQEYEKISKAHNPYCDGKACERIVEFIKEEK